MLSSPRCVVAFSQRTTTTTTTTTTSARHGYVVREKKITTNNNNNNNASGSRRRRYRRTWWVTSSSSSSTNGEDAEGEKKTSWKVVSESPFASSNSDSSLASEQPALRIEAESSSSSSSRIDGGGEDEELKGIPINSSRRATKMLFTCNKCGIRTERRVNKQNLTTGTTWVQCGNPSCSVWHKIVDNLGLIYECSEMD